jgi:hypothetical protein
MSEDVIHFKYTFVFGNGDQKTFEIALRQDDLTLMHEIAQPYPEWTRLGNVQCPNCPLSEADNPHCPAALNLSHIIEVFKKTVSYDEVDVTIESDERFYVKHDSVQQGLSSMIGIYMVTSGCPIMERLKPMVRYHLPFATTEETKYRVLSMYLLAQYFRHRQGETPDWEFKDLSTIYNEIRTVNKNFCGRLSTVIEEDASINALVVLNCFADSVSFSLNGDMMADLEHLFQAYLRNDSLPSPACARNHALHRGP